MNNLINNLKNNRQIFIIGSMGTGKTVLSRYIKNRLDVDIFEDMTYKLMGINFSNNYSNRIRKLKNIFKSSIKNKPTLFLVHNIIPIPPNDKDEIIWLFTSVHGESIRCLNQFGVRKNIINKFHKAQLNAFEGKKRTKTRPYLFVSQTKSFMGRYGLEDPKQ